MMDEHNFQASACSIPMASGRQRNILNGNTQPLEISRIGVVMGDYRRPAQSLPMPAASFSSWSANFPSGVNAIGHMDGFSWPSICGHPVFFSFQNRCWSVVGNTAISSSWVASLSSTGILSFQQWGGYLELPLSRPGR